MNLCRATPLTLPEFRSQLQQPALHCLRPATTVLSQIISCKLLSAEHHIIYNLIIRNISVAVFKFHQMLPELVPILHTRTMQSRDIQHLLRWPQEHLRLCLLITAFAKLRIKLRVCLTVGQDSSLAALHSYCGACCWLCNEFDEDFCACNKLSSPPRNVVSQ